MALNSDLYDVENYSLKWLRVFNYVRRLGFESYCMLNMCCLIFYYLMICVIMLSDNIIIELCELS